MALQGKKIDELVEKDPVLGTDLLPIWDIVAGSTKFATFTSVSNLLQSLLDIYTTAEVDAFVALRVLISDLASQAEAEAGTNNTKWMSPLRVKQAFDDFFTGVATAFLGLTDTPSSYSGEANKLVSVTGAEDGLEFIDPPPGDFLGLTDTPSSYSGETGKVPAVNGAEDGLEFITPGTGDVVGPASAVDLNIAIFDGATGKLIADSGVSVANIVPDASESVKGKIEIATQAEVDAGTDDLRAITPLKLKSLTSVAGFGWVDDVITEGFPGSSDRVSTENAVKTYVDSQITPDITAIIPKIGQVSSAACDETFVYIGRNVATTVIIYRYKIIGGSLISDSGSAVNVTWVANTTYKNIVSMTHVLDALGDFLYVGCQRVSDSVDVIIRIDVTDETTTEMTFSGGSPSGILRNIANTNDAFLYIIGDGADTTMKKYTLPISGSTLTFSSDTTLPTAVNTTGVIDLLVTEEIDTGFMWYLTANDTILKRAIQGATVSETKDARKDGSTTFTGTFRYNSKFYVVYADTVTDVIYAQRLE